MPRKQAKRRKKSKNIIGRIPSLTIIQTKVLGICLLVIICCTLFFQFGGALLDRPINTITIEGPFQRVTALQIEEAIGDQLGSGLFSADLKIIRQQITALDWIDDANVARRWPGKLSISVTEQIPAAIWGKAGLLNTRGDLFVTNTRHIPPELPQLSGPEGFSSVVAQRYLNLRESLIPIGLDVRIVSVDTRGAWEIILSNGVEVRFGRREIEERTKLFVDVIAELITRNEGDISFVDLRYSNGFTIGWKNGLSSLVNDKNVNEIEIIAGLEN